MDKVILIHGFEANPDKNWLPWLKKELENLDFEVDAPLMPSPSAPVLSEWQATIENLVNSYDGDVYLVGHSLGCPTILRYLESLNGERKIIGAVLVAGFASSIGSVEHVEAFVAGEWNDAAIKRSVNKLVYIHSDNDPYIPISIGENMKSRFGGELLVFEKSGHFNWRDGYTELPVVLEMLQEMRAKNG